MKFYNKCSENSRSQIVFRTDIFRKLTLGVPADSLTGVLYKPRLQKEIKMTCRVSCQSRSAPEGVWVQGGGIEIPCVYEIGVKKGLRSLRKELRDKLIQLVPTTDNTI